MGVTTEGPIKVGDKVKYRIGRGYGEATVTSCSDGGYSLKTKAGCYIFRKAAFVSLDQPADSTAQVTNS